MRCLYCGKQLALLRRLTGNGTFCTQAHKQAYNDEYNKLALSRLLQCQESDDSKAASKKPLELGVPGQERSLRLLEKGSDSSKELVRRTASRQAEIPLGGPLGPEPPQANLQISSPPEAPFLSEKPAIEVSEALAPRHSDPEPFREEMRLAIPEHRPAPQMGADPPAAGVQKFSAVIEQLGSPAAPRASKPDWTSAPKIGLAYPAAIAPRQVRGLTRRGPISFRPALDGAPQNPTFTAFMDPESRGMPGLIPLPLRPVQPNPAPLHRLEPRIPPPAMPSKFMHVRSGREEEPWRASGSRHSAAKLKLAAMAAALPAGEQNPAAPQPHPAQKERAVEDQSSWEKPLVRRTTTRTLSILEAEPAKPEESGLWDTLRNYLKP